MDKLWCLSEVDIFQDLSPAVLAGTEAASVAFYAPDRRSNADLYAEELDVCVICLMCEPCCSETCAATRGSPRPSLGS